MNVTTQSFGHKVLSVLMALVLVIGLAPMVPAEKFRRRKRGLLTSRSRRASRLPLGPLSSAMTPTTATFSSKSWSTA